MSQFTYAPQIVLEAKRCYTCGSYYAIETARGWRDPQCPFCAGEAIRKSNERATAAERGRNALKGVIAKLKRHN